MVFDDIPIAARNSKFPENVAETVGPRWVQAQLGHGREALQVRGAN